MILTRDKHKVVYVGRCNSEVMYVGRGCIGRAGNLIGKGHHIDYDFDEVEILGPYTDEESRILEKSLIEEHTPHLNKKLNPSYSLKEAIQARAVRRRIEREAAAEKIYRMQISREVILQRIKAGENMSQIAREFGVSRQRIHQIKSKYL